MLSSSIFGQIGEELGLVGCIESLKVESKDVSKEYDLMYPGSRDIIGGSGIGEYVLLLAVERYSDYFVLNIWENVPFQLR